MGPYRLPLVIMMATKDDGLTFIFAILSMVVVIVMLSLENSQVHCVGAGCAWMVRFSVTGDPMADTTTLFGSGRTSKGESGGITLITITQ